MRSRVLVAVLATAAAGLAPSRRRAAPARAHAVIDPADYQQVELATGVGRARRADVAGRAAQPLGPPHRPQRHGPASPTPPATPRWPATSPSTPTTRRACRASPSTPASPRNRFIYLYYSPPLSTPGRRRARPPAPRRLRRRGRGHLNLSRFTLNADDTLNLASERVVLEVRQRPRHVLPRRRRHRLRRGRQPLPDHRRRHQPVRVQPATRPIDERTNRNPQYDAQRTSAQHQRPARQGAADQAERRRRPTPSRPATCSRRAPPNTRPEIYAMGFRNPFRMSVDKPTGIVYLGDYGPDAGGTDAEPRARAGRSSSTGSPRPGNYGWPYCTGTNTTAETYNEWNFADRTDRAEVQLRRRPDQQLVPQHRPADAAAGPRRAGSGTAATPASPPEFGGGSESPMGGPVYRYDAALELGGQVPAVAGRALLRRRVRPPLDQGDRRQRQRHRRARSPPSRGPAPRSWTWRSARTARSTCSTTAPASARRATRRCTGSSTSAAATAARSPWRVGQPDLRPGAADRQLLLGRQLRPRGRRADLPRGRSATAPRRRRPTRPRRTPPTAPTPPTLRVTDPQGLTGTASLVVTVGNTAPTVTLTDADRRPAVHLRRHGAVHRSASATPRTARSTARRVTVTYPLGHDSHAHQITSQTGCSGTITVPVDGEHDAAANIFGVFDATYTDNGGLTTHSTSTAAAEAPPGRALRRPVRRPDRRRTRPPRAATPSATSTTATGSRSRRTRWATPPSSPRGSPPAGAGGTHRGPRRLADRHAARHRRRAGDRRLGDVHRRLDQPAPAPRPAPRPCTWCSTAAPAPCSTSTRSPSTPAPATQPSTRVEAESFTSQSGDPGGGGRRRPRRQPGRLHRRRRLARVRRGRRRGADRASPPGSPPAGPAAPSRSASGSATGPVLGSVAVPNTGGYGDLRRRSRRR